MPLAPEKFVAWLASHEHRDDRYGWVYQYHPRSNAHSVALCRFIMEDLLACCSQMHDQASAGKVVYGINYRHQFSLTKKKKISTWQSGSERQTQRLNRCPASTAGESTRSSCPASARRR